MSSRVDVGLAGREVWLVDATIVRAAGGGKEDDPDEPDDYGLGRSRWDFQPRLI